MKTKNLSEYRQQLLQRLTELEIAMASIKDKMIEIVETQTNALQDSLDHASEQSELSAHSKMIQKHSSERDQLLAALNRIEKGTFGECIDCGDVIEAKRLSAHPSASLCVECQCLKEDCTGLEIESVKKINLRTVLPFFIFGVEAA